jgi:aldehyde dehydrogenase (NAD+)
LQNTGLIKEIRANFETRKSYDVEYRVGQLQNLRRGVVELEKEITDAVHKDLRKHVVEGFLGEVGSTISEVDFALDNIRKWAENDAVWAPIHFQPATLKTVKQPKGVTLVIVRFVCVVNIVMY